MYTNGTLGDLHKSGHELLSTSDIIYPRDTRSGLKHGHKSRVPQLCH